jgi:cation:H+ antiporter
MDGLPLWLLAVIFAAAAAVVWVAGIQLSRTTDVLDARLGIGSALGGLIVLAIATNLPEIAITVSAAMSGDVSVAVGNILGGIALQTVVLVILDVFGTRPRGGRPLTYRAASLVLVIEGVMVVAILTVVVAGTQLPSTAIFGRLTADVLLIAVLWIAALLLVRRASVALPWQATGDASMPSRRPQRRRSRPEPPHASMSTAKAWSVFTVAALATLAAGVALERSGDAAADELGMSGVLFGATFLALATSLPEISTGLQAVKQGDDDLAVSDIFGGNAFLPVLFLVATLITGTAVLPGAGAANIYLTALGALLTVVYIVGLIFRPTRRVAGMGIDSLVVLVLYVIGIVGLFAVAGGG